MTAPLMNFEGSFALPGISEALETVSNQFWWGRWENQIWASSAIIDGATRDAGNTGYTDVLREGLLLGKVTTTGKLKQWDPTATDGTQNVYGILSLSQKTTRNGANADRYLGYIMIGGLVKASKLAIPSSTSLGISGNASEHLIRAQMFGRFMFDDNLNGNAFGGWRDVVAKTAAYTVTEADNGTIFTNRGASGSVTFTLPATAEKGLRYRFVAVADQTIIVAGGTADTMVGYNNATADSVSFATSSEKIGGSFEIIGDGTGWLVFPCAYGLGATAQTVTTTDA